MPSRTPPRHSTSPFSWSRCREPPHGPERDPAAAAPSRTSRRLQDEVRALARERDAVILAHNYQLPEVQDVADYVGDSLGLVARRAATDADVIAFCGVHFMAETASILSPGQDRADPRPRRGLLAGRLDHPEQLRAWQAKHPGAITVMYVNTTAEIKALTDYCVTSANAVAVVEHILREHGEDTEILFGPDMFLGAYVEKSIGRSMHVWDGECHVHAGIRPADIARMRAEHPGADFLIHPECGCSTSVMEYVAAGDVDAEGVHMLSTGGMLELRRQRAGRATTAIMATETGMLHPLRMAAPDVDFIAANEAATCRYMKMITLPKLRDCLRDLTRRGAGAAETSPSAPACRSSAWSRSASARAAVNTFAGGGLDRMGPRRTDAAWLAERRADPASRAVVATSDGVLVDRRRDRRRPSASPRSPAGARARSCSASIARRRRACSPPTPAPSAAPRCGRRRRSSGCATSPRCRRSPTRTSSPTRPACSTGTAATASARTAAPPRTASRPATCGTARTAARSTTRAPTRS